MLQIQSFRLLQVFCGKYGCSQHQVECNVQCSLKCENHTQSPAKEVHGCDCIRNMLCYAHSRELFDTELLRDVLWKSVLVNYYVQSLELHESL